MVNKKIEKKRAQMKKRNCLKNNRGQMKTKKTGNFLAFNCLKNNRAQMKIQQMAFMLLAIFVFFILAGIFVLSFKMAELKETANELESENAFLLASRIANSPELSCSEVYSTTHLSCIDADKAMALKENIEKYKNYWGDRLENIEIKIIYPEKEEVACDLGNYPNCNLISLFNKEIVGTCESNFVSVCKKQEIEGEINNLCEIGRIYVCYNKVN